MVRVSVNDGMLEGEEVENEYGGKFFSFKGIPFAKPPLGDLRFKAPQPPEPWTGVRDAKQFGSVCPQFNFMNPTLGNMSEDCLYINVYTPEMNPVRLIPVMFWVHGGGYIWGSGNDDMYGPQFLIRYGVVLVTFNYRLEALGYLCLDTPDVPGNAGMKDQVAALRWVKQNIGNFGGDPDNITMFGESAGAASISFHLISPMSKGLFRRAITQSGSATCRWSQYFEPRDKALYLAKQLGCYSEDDKELYEFFKQQPVESLLKLKLRIYKSQKPYEIHFAIAAEKDFGQERFFYGDVTDALRNGIHPGVDVMAGYAQDEGLMAVTLDNSLEKMVAEAKFFHEFFVPEFINIHCVISDQLEVGRKIRKYYIRDGAITEEGVLQFLSTDMFVYGVMLSIKFYAKKNKVFFYKFNCSSERNFLGHWFGLDDVIQDKPVVCHADDLAYMFPIKLVVKEKVDEESKTFKLINRVTTLWTNFAKYGNPTPNNSLGVIWKPYTLDGEDYLNLGNELSTGKAPDKAELEFWESIFKQYLPKYTI